MKMELLAPAGDFECFLQAIYNGADAIYLATDKFGARAYAKNFSLEELEKALILAHQLNKKIYVTVNTMIKENELSECKKYIKTLYELGVDGLILSDYSIICYTLKHCPNMEVHISTQAGIKDIYDVSFFKDLNVDRCVLARETSIDDIKKIKESIDMPLEVFMHGALCVSYSGGCLFSSMLTLRSGNRGRCAQNCRREYSLYKDDNLLGKGYFLSMRDLNTSNYLNEFKKINVDSLKIEGRMKDASYVKMVVSEYRKKIDNPEYNPKYLDSIFHRNYTKGFIFNEDKGSIVDITKRTNEGSYIGTISNKVNQLTKIDLKGSLKVGDRIRIENELDYYFTIDKIYDLNNKEISSSTKPCLLNIYKDMKIGSKIYKMVDSSIDLTITDKMKKPIKIKCYGSIGKPLKLVCKIDNKEFIGLSSSSFLEATSRPIDEATLFNQLKKLNETSFYLEKIENYLAPNLFMTISNINEARRNLINNINEYYQNKRNDFIDYEEINEIKYDNNPIEISCYCETLEQYNACVKAGIKDIYYDSNYINYVNAKYNDVSGLILTGGYGGIYNYRNKNNVIVSDYSFNVSNSESVYNLLNNGVDIVTLSLELSNKEINDLYNSYINKYNTKPNIEIIVYGHQKLMTLKYCMLKRYNECAKCDKHFYYLKDDKNKFLTSRNNCITSIYNEKALNLIDELDTIKKYTNRIRLQFSIENYDEVLKIINNYKEKLYNINTNKLYFDKDKETRGYFKREIL